mmetsp:Transcript_25308/g.51499  ORF Transcript_25308/g.51499 Transcript_25308/m.51499 type:complete len:360 (+) Transcript_25308:1056-2135(+)
MRPQTETLLKQRLGHVPASLAAVLPTEVAVDSDGKLLAEVLRRFWRELLEHAHACRVGVPHRCPAPRRHGRRHVVRVQLHRVAGSDHLDAIDEPAKHPHLGAEDRPGLAREEERDAVLLGGGLQPGREVHVRAEVRDVHLVLAADGALHRPPKVQPEPHPDAVPRQPLLYAFALRPRLQLRVALHLLDDSDEGREGVVCSLRHLEHRRLPHDKECVADALVRAPVVIVHGPMHVPRNGVHQLGDLRLKRLGERRELPDVAEPEKGQHDLTRHRVHRPARQHVGPHKLRPGLAKRALQQAGEVGHRALDNVHLPQGALSCRCVVQGDERLEGVVEERGHAVEHPVHRRNKLRAESIEYQR